MQSPRNASIRYRRLGYVALNVSDIDRSERFYRDLVGLEALEQPGPDGCRFLRCGPEHHAVILYQGDKPGLKRIGFEMESSEALDDLVAVLEAEGIPARELSREECAPFRLGRCVRVNEPHTGATFDFFDSMREFGSRPFVPTVAQIQRLGHVVIKTPRYEEAVRFFREVLNFSVSDEVYGAITFFRAFPNPYHHSLGISRGARPTLHHVNFMVSEVDDIGRAMWRFQRAEVPIVNGPGRHPPSGSMFYYFLDPDELTIEYSFGMEEFPETGARKPRVLEPGPNALDFWGSPTDPRKSATGHVEQA